MCFLYVMSSLCFFLLFFFFPITCKTNCIMEVKRRPNFYICTLKQWFYVCFIVHCYVWLWKIPIIMSGGVSFGLTPPGLNMMYISQAGQFDIPQRKIMYSNPNVVFFLFLFFFFPFTFSRTVESFCGGKYTRVIIQCTSPWNVMLVIHKCEQEWFRLRF